MAEIPHSNILASSQKSCYNWQERGGYQMARDMAKKSVYDKKWDAENCARYNIKVRTNSGIPCALKKAENDGNSRNSYITSALREKLIRDGYLNPENVE